MDQPASPRPTCIDPDPTIFFGTIAGDVQSAFFNLALRRPAGAGRRAFDVWLVHGGVGRVFRAPVLGHGRHDAAHRRGRAGHAVPDARDDDDLPLPEHGARENEAALGGGGAQVLRLRVGLVGAVPVRPQPGLRHDGHDRSSTRSSKLLQTGGTGGSGGQRGRGHGDPAC